MATYWENSCSFCLQYVSWYKCLIVGFVFSHLGFWSGNLFLIAPFPDLCLRVPFCYGKTFKHQYLQRQLADLDKITHTASLGSRKGSLVSSVPMRDQRIVEHTLNSVIDI